jgi:hypothetical protein
MHQDSLTLRIATAEDAEALARLVELEEARPLRGEVILAELDGRVMAALSVHDDRAVADIFRPTAEIVAMLRARRGALIRARRFPEVIAPRSRGMRGLVRRRAKPLRIAA